MGGKIHFEPATPIELQGAPTEIRAIVHTLMANAVEASAAKANTMTENLAKGSAVTENSAHFQPPRQTPDIQVFVQQNEQQVTVKVMDQGNGIAPHIKPELFKPHVSDKPEGAGMGLFIANRICQSYYQGKIRLDDNQPHGCVATVTFGTGKQWQQQQREESV